jgi:hypothetical protein
MCCIDIQIRHDSYNDSFGPSIGCRENLSVARGYVALASRLCSPGGRRLARPASSDPIAAR